MYDVESRLIVGVDFVFGSIADRGLRRYEDLPEMLFIDGEGDAIGRSRVVEKLGVDGGNFFIRNEIERNFSVFRV